MILREEFFKPRRVTQSAVAKATGIPRSRLSEILSGRRPLTADVAARLGSFFEVDPRNAVSGLADAQIPALTSPSDIRGPIRRTGG